MGRTGRATRKGSHVDGRMRVHISAVNVHLRVILGAEDGEHLLMCTGTFCDARQRLLNIEAPANARSHR